MRRTNERVIERKEERVKCFAVSAKTINGGGAFQYKGLSSFVPQVAFMQSRFSAGFLIFTPAADLHVAVFDLISE